MNWEIVAAIVPGAVFVIGGLVWLVRMEGQIKLLNECKGTQQKDIDLLFELKRKNEDELKKDFSEIKNSMVNMQLLLQRIVTHLKMDE